MSLVVASPAAPPTSGAVLPGGDASAQGGDPLFAALLAGQTTGPDQGASAAPLGARGPGLTPGRFGPVSDPAVAPGPTTGAVPVGAQGDPGAGAVLVGAQGNAGAPSASSQATDILPAGPPASAPQEGIDISAVYSAPRGEAETELGVPSQKEGLQHDSDPQTGDLPTLSTPIEWPFIPAPQPPAQASSPKAVAAAEPQAEQTSPRLLVPGAEALQAADITAASAEADAKAEVAAAQGRFPLPLAGGPGFARFAERSVGPDRFAPSGRSSAKSVAPSTASIAAPSSTGLSGLSAPVSVQHAAGTSVAPAGTLAYNQQPDQWFTAEESADGEAATPAPDHLEGGAASSLGAPTTPQSTAFSTPRAEARSTPATVQSLAAELIRKLDQRISRFEMALNPAGLGRVDVAMQIGAQGRLTASLSFDRPQSAAELQARAPELETALREAGFDLAPGAISFAQLDAGLSGGAGGQGARQFSEERAPRANPSARAFGAAAELGDPPPHAYARRAARGLDIQV